MTKPKRTYSNAGAQTVLAQIGAVRFWNESEDYLVPVKTIAIVFKINRNKVNLIPVQKRMIDKRGYYRKGDVLAWAYEDSKQPDSLLQRLQEEQSKTNERLRRQPYRKYVSGQPSREDAKKMNKNSDDSGDCSPKMKASTDLLGLWAPPITSQKD
jgi:hypothetical protein